MPQTPNPKHRGSHRFSKFELRTPKPKSCFGTASLVLSRSLSIMGLVVVVRVEEGPPNMGWDLGLRVLWSTLAKFL